MKKSRWNRKNISTHALELKVADGPANATSLFKLGRQYYDAQRYREAAEMLRKAVEADSRDGRTWYYLGASLLRCYDAELHDSTPWKREIMLTDMYEGVCAS